MTYTLVPATRRTIDQAIEMHFGSYCKCTIRYDSVYLTCSKKLTGSQLSLPHGCVAVSAFTLGFAEHAALLCHPKTSICLISKNLRW